MHGCSIDVTKQVEQPHFLGHPVGYRITPVFRITSHNILSDVLAKTLRLCRPFSEMLIRICIPLNNVVANL